MAHKGFYLSASDYRAAREELSRVVRRFETALSGVFLRALRKNILFSTRSAFSVNHKKEVGK